MDNRPSGPRPGGRFLPKPLWKQGFSSLWIVENSVESVDNIVYSLSDRGQTGG